MARKAHTFIIDMPDDTELNAAIFRGGVFDAGHDHSHVHEPHDHAHDHAHDQAHDSLHEARDHLHDGDEPPPAAGGHPPHHVDGGIRQAARSIIAARRMAGPGWHRGLLSKSVMLTLDVEDRMVLSWETVEGVLEAGQCDLLQFPKVDGLEETDAPMMMECADEIVLEMMLAGHLHRISRSPLDLGRTPAWPLLPGLCFLASAPWPLLPRLCSLAFASSTLLTLAYPA